MGAETYPATHEKRVRVIASRRDWTALPMGLLAGLFASHAHEILDRLDAKLEVGSILGHLPDGTKRLLGGRADGFDAEVYLHDWRGLLRLVMNGSIGWFEAWDRGEWTSPDLVSVFAVFGANARSLGAMGRSKGLFRWIARFGHWLNRNNRRGSRRNIHAHYDIGNAFYEPWLGPSMTYSSGLAVMGDGLERSHEQKFTALSERIGSAKEVLEIGCGWGALAEHLARENRTVTAISLSDEQLEWARRNDIESIEYRKQDYRDVDGRFDAIVSVEMVEALGREYWPAFLHSVARNLRPGGRAALQFISMRDDLFEAYADSADFIQTYVFPGGLLIKMSEFRAIAERCDLEWRDQVDFGQDYAETLKIWRERFDRAVANRLLPDRFDDKLIRLWRYYLSYCEGGFRCGNVNVHQVTLVKPA